MRMGGDLNQKSEMTPNPLSGVPPKQQEENRMLPIRGLYEVAIRVKDLARAEPFYREVLGLQVGLRDEKRNWVFLRAGGEDGMIVLQEDQGARPTQHLAFTIQ